MVVPYDITGTPEGPFIYGRVYLNVGITMNKGLLIVLLMAVALLFWWFILPYMSNALIIIIAIQLLIIVGLPLALVQLIVYVKKKRQSRNQRVSAKPSGAYVKCTNCGSEEFIEIENGRVMVPYEDAEHNYVTISAVDYFTCARCGSAAGYVPVLQTQPVAGREYIPCEACGSTEFLMTVATRVKIRGDRSTASEDIEKSVSTMICLKCGHRFDEPVRDEVTHFGSAMAVAHGSDGHEID